MGWLDMIRGILAWMWAHKNVAMYLILAVIIAFLTWRNNGLKQTNDKMTIEAGKLPDNIEFTASMHGTKFQITYRDSKNNVVHKQFYVPEEGGINITKRIDLKNYDPNSALATAINAAGKKLPTLNPVEKFISKLLGPTVSPNPDIDIQVRNWGVCFKPGIQGIWDGGFKPERPVTIGIDAKLFYAYRYSAGLGTTIDYPNIWLSRHVDDLVPFITVSHLELMLGYGKPYSNFSNSVMLLGGRTNF
jgi:hypothetical protein